MVIDPLTLHRTVLFFTLQVYIYILPLIYQLLHLPPFPLSFKTPQPPPTLRVNSAAYTAPDNTTSNATSSTPSTSSSSDISADLDQPGQQYSLSSTSVTPSLPCYSYHCHRIPAYNERLSRHERLHSCYCSF